MAEFEEKTSLNAEASELEANGVYEITDNELENVSGGVSREVFVGLTPGTRIKILYGEHTDKYATITGTPHTGRASYVNVQLDDGSETSMSMDEFELA